MAAADKKLVTNGKISGTLIKKPTIRKAQLNTNNGNNKINTKKNIHQRIKVLELVRKRRVKANCSWAIVAIMCTDLAIDK